MEYFISDKMAKLKPSAIREILKYGADPSVISLAAGDPAPESLPVHAIKEIMAEIFADDPMQAMLYSQSEGHPPLRALLKTFVKERYDAFDEERDDLIVVTGAQQGLDLATKVLCNEGDVIICEEPSFVGALNAFRSYNAKIVGISIDDDGINLERLEAALKENSTTRFIYLIPNFQNPTGITTSLEKRKAVYELAKQYGTLILEDNPYGDLRFTGETVPTIKSFDKDGIVLYAGTFSKILSSGIRIGFLIAPKPIMGKIIVAKQCTDVHTSMPTQLLAYKFLSDYSLDDHIEQLKVIYKEKCELMLSSLDEYLPPWVSHTVPSGGLFVWCTLRDGMDTQEIALRLVQEKKVCIVPGSAFLIEGDSFCSSFRLNFSKISKEGMVEGIKRIGQLLFEYD